MAVKPSTKVLAKKPVAKATVKSVQAQPSPSRVSVSNGCQERSVEIRKIDNGYIIRESTYGGKAGYKSSERYSATAPVIDVPKMVKGKK